MSFHKPLPYFGHNELASPDTGMIVLDRHFAVALPYLRSKWGEALYLNSACRSPQYNTKIGGHPRSLHMTKNPVHPSGGCMAADIRWHNWSDDRKLEFARLAWDERWSIGLNDAFCHIDRRRDIGLSQGVFTYDAWSRPFEPDEVIDP